MKKMIFHCGVHRTGSTTVQSVMKKNKGILRSHGILYPSLFGLPDHVKIPWWVKNKKITLEELKDEILGQDEDIIETIVISAEDFCILKDVDFLEYFSKYFDVHVALYLKEQSSWIESWYNQHIKWPWERRFSNCDVSYFMDNLDDFYWIDYNETLDKFCSVVGKDNVYVKRLGSKGINDTVTDFIDFCGVDVKFLHPFKMANESLKASSLEIIRRLNLIDVKGGARHKIIKAVEDLNVEGDRGDKYVLDNKQRKMIHERFKESNNLVSEKYFDGGSLFGRFRNRDVEPFKLSDEDVYKVYIPALSKKLAESGSK